MRLLAKLEKHTDFWFLIASCIIFFFLRIPSLFEPYWYGDEGIYEVIGFAMRHGRMLYSGIWDNKPPLLYITYALFSGDQFAAKLLSIFFGMSAIIAFYFLAKQLFTNATSVRVATGFFAFFFGIPLLEGNIANAENFMLFFIILAATLLYKSKLNKQYLFIAGILLGIAFLYKIVAVFDATAFGVFLLIVRYKKNEQVLNVIKNLLPFLSGFVVPVFLIGLFFLLLGSFKEFYTGAFVQNVGYVGYANTFFIPQGLLITKLLLLITVVFFLFSYRKKFTQTELFIYLWFAFSVCNVFFSQRPYTHYMLLLLPSISLLWGLIFWQKVKQHFAITTFIAILLLLVLNFHFYAKSISYYANFTNYISGKESTASYEKFFDANVIRDVAVADYLNQHKHYNDDVFLWGNSAQVYKLSGTIPPGRYTVAYHVTANIQSLDETEAAIEKTKPRYIVIFDNAAPYPYNLINYKEVIRIADSQIYEKQ